MRQTALSIKDLRDHFNGFCILPYPRCLLINELGEIAQVGPGHPGMEAQRILVSLLFSTSAEDRWIAYRCLVATREAECATQDTKDYLGAFESDPDNREITS